MQKDGKLSNIFRFIDDPCFFNNDGFVNNSSYTYPDVLELKKENEDTCKASFLDFSIEVHERKFTTKLFDKKDVFPFYINRILIQIQYAISNTLRFD